MTLKEGNIAHYAVVHYYKEAAELLPPNLPNRKVRVKNSTEQQRHVVPLCLVISRCAIVPCDMSRKQHAYVVPIHKRYILSDRVMSYAKFTRMSAR